MKEIVPLTKEQKALAAAAMRQLTELGTAHIARYPARLREDLLQEFLKAGAMAAADYDPARGTSFVSYAWRCGVSAVINHVSLGWRQEKRLLALKMVHAVGGVLEMAPAPTEDELFRSTDADQHRRLADLNDAMAAAMALVVVGRTTPEMELLVAQDRARVRAALDEILGTLADDERRMILRRFVDGEELTALFGPTSEPAYRAGTKRLYALVARLGAEFKKRGIGPSTARTVADVDLGERDERAPADG